MYAEYCLIDQHTAMPIPNNFSYIEAAAVPEAFLTANEAIFTLGCLQKGESILIHAGASGVGSAGIQLAKQIGATVFTTIRSPEKIEKIKLLQPDEIIQNFSDDVPPVDVIIDFIGADYFAKNIRILKPGGRLICVGLMGGKKAEIELDQIQKRRLQIKGLIMRSRSLEDKRAITKRFFQQWFSSLENRQILPVIDSVFPFDQVQKAHMRMEENANVGKIILEI